MNPRRYSEGRFNGIIAPNDDPTIQLVFSDGSSFKIHDGCGSRDPILFEMPEMVPDSDLAALGLFITSWSGLETALHRNFERLLGVGYGPAAAISYANSGTQLVKLVDEQLCLFELKPEEKKEHDRLVKRFGKKNTHRNRIIHGTWRFVVDLHRVNDQLNLRVNLAREYIPSRLADRKKLEENDQKTVANYSFDADRLETLSSEVASLCVDFDKFYTSLDLEGRFSWGRTSRQGDLQE